MIKKQVHTHMCYSEFNHTIEAIADTGADVITIDTLRLAMELLDIFDSCQYPNDIEPGIYGVHSPNQPSEDVIFAIKNMVLA